jgi:hypothetical protein
VEVPQAPQDNDGDCKNKLVEAKMMPGSPSFGNKIYVAPTEREHESINNIIEEP